MTTSPIPTHTLIFAYGTLKRGFPNHNLLHDLISQKDATFIGNHKTLNAFPLIIGPHGIPYLLNRPGSGSKISGEVYSVTKKGKEMLDKFEGVEIGHYERLPVEIWCDDVDSGVRVLVKGEAYFGHRSFGDEMWRKRSGFMVEEYTVEMAKRYVRKAERIGGSGCILEDIKMFLEASSG